VVRRLNRSIVLLALVATLSLSIYPPFPATSGDSHTIKTVEHIGLPRLDHISFKVIKTEDATVDALLANKIDVMSGPSKLLNIEKVVAAGFNQTWDPSASYGHLQINCRDYFPEEAGDLAGLPAQPLNYSEWREAMTYVFGMDRKATSIYEYYGGPQVFAAENIIPSAQAYWYDPAYRFPNTDLDYAWSLLEDAGFTVADSVLYNPDGTPVRDLEAVWSGGMAWGSIGGDFVKYMNEFMDYIGAAVSPEFTIHPEDFWTLIYSLLGYHDFDMIFIGFTGLSVNPDWLVDMFHSRNIGWWGWNTVGFVDPYVDELMDIVAYSLDIDEVLQAAHDFQDYFKHIVPQFPITWSHSIATYHPDLQGFIPTKCYGSVENEHTWSTMHWADTPVGGSVRRPLGDEPTNLHPWYEDTSYGWLMMDMVFGSQMISMEPKTLKVIPWIAYDWDLEVWKRPGIESGMKVTFKLRNDVTWHDGTPLTAHDAKFHFDMFMKYKPPKYDMMWRNLVYAETDGDYILHLYYNATSLWHLYAAAECLRAPKHIWSKVDEMVEEGILDDIKKFDPQTPYEDITGVAPPAEYPYLKAGMVGCGPYVWKYYDPSLMVGEVHKYNQYWVQSPVEAAVDAYYRADPDGTLNYSIVLLNTGAIGVNGSLADATVDVEIYVDDELVNTITDTTVPFLDYVRLGQFTTGALAAGGHTIAVKVYEGGEPIDTYTHTIYSTIPEDINWDFKVRVDDVLAAAVAFGSAPGHPRWNLIADINDDFKVRVDDILAIALKFGWG